MKELAELSLGANVALRHVFVAAPGADELILGNGERYRALVENRQSLENRPRAVIPAEGSDERRTIARATAMALSNFASEAPDFLLERQVFEVFEERYGLGLLLMYASYPRGVPALWHVKSQASDDDGSS